MSKIVEYRNSEGKRHRLDGPAYISGNYQEWYKNGKLHREDGPAVIDGKYLTWYVDGVQYTEAEFNEKFLGGAENRTGRNTVTFTIPDGYDYEIVIRRRTRR